MIHKPQIVNDLIKQQQNHRTGSTMAETPYHIPALREQTIEALAIKPDGVYADATFGGGGHSRAVLECLGSEGKLYGFDQDMDASSNCPADERFTFVHSNFRHIRNFMRYHGIDRFDGIVADLGVSFHHFDAAERGFSFREDAPLDMRMNQKAPQSAADLLAEASEETISGWLRAYADLKKPSAVAKAIAEAREKGALRTTGDLARAVTGALNPKSEKKELAQVFQTLRIAVNHETDALIQFLESMPLILKPGGRLAVLTYHSVEDRLVKNFFRAGNAEGEQQKDFYGRVETPWKPVTRKPIVPTAEEIERNPRARSAKLRVAEYTGADASKPLSR